MIPTVKTYIKQYITIRLPTEKNPAEAYDLWSTEYDAQPGNLMLDLDAVIFPKLLEKASVKDKKVADIGCGTGRHWEKLLQLQPASLAGFDVSKGMLEKLKEKFSGADVYKINNDRFSNIPNASFDLIVSTLTVAHIKNIELALKTWCRILKPNGEIIITDFHPKMLAFGGKRTFKYQNQQMSVQNFVHPVRTIKNLLKRNGFMVVAEEEIMIDETVKHYYVSQNALPVYEQYQGFPVIYGIHLRRCNDPE